MPVGIEKLDMYVGKLMVDALDLAEARGRDRASTLAQVMMESRSVTPVWEDAVTLAVNAAKRLLAGEEMADIELLIVGTESAVDFAKPISTWVHRFCGLPSSCRSFEVKHACYGGTAALKMAASWVASAARPGKKALVVSSDLTRRSTRDHFDFVGGGCAVAMLVSAQPDILEIDLSRTGYWTSEIYDAWRPTFRLETVDNEISLFSYLDALEGAFENYQQAAPGDYRNDFKRHIYHAPFPGMTLHAHRTLLGGLGADRSAIQESFDRKVAGGISIGKRIGTAYGSSTFISLMSLLQPGSDLEQGDRVSIFSYGSGCQGEFYDGVIGPRAGERMAKLDIDSMLEERWPLTVEEYERVECVRGEQFDKPDSSVNHATVPGAYEQLYRGRNLLVLDRVEDHRRMYAWS